MILMIQDERGLTEHVRAPAGMCEPFIEYKGRVWQVIERLDDEEFALAIRQNFKKMVLL